MLDDRDVWWDVGKSTDAKELCTCISERYLAPLLDWFDRYDSLESIKQALAQFEKYGDVPGVFVDQAPLIQAIIGKVHGDRAATEGFIRKALDGSAGKPLERTVRTIASRVGVNIA